MNGAESLVGTLAAGGCEVCFTNPGTSEMHIVAALDRQTRIRSVLALFEGVVTAAADGYARMTGKPACTLLHLGPGFANGIANLHNARRARVPIVNIIGDHATFHLKHDTPLQSDIEALARPLSAWLRTSRSASEVGQDAADALLAAQCGGGQVATLIVPADLAWLEVGKIAPIAPAPNLPIPSSTTVDRAAKMLRANLHTAILVSGNALYGGGLAAAARITAATGARLLAPYPITRIERGSGRAVIDRIPYVPEQATELLREFRQLILVGGMSPFSYFAAPGRGSKLTPADCEIFSLAEPQQDCAGALHALIDALSLRGSSAALLEKKAELAIPHGDITLPGLATAIAATLPENAILIDESMTSGRGIFAATRGAKHHDVLVNTGGSIGIAMPLAVGAAVACPDRRVLCLSADGSGMYTSQALWTMAREDLKVTTVIFANREYTVLRREFANLGIGKPGPQARSLFDIGRPNLDWVALAKGMGVPGRKVASLEEFGNALQAGYESQGPSLIEVPV